MGHLENVVGARPSAAERPQESGAAALGRGGRMSRQRKTAAVLRRTSPIPDDGVLSRARRADRQWCRWGWRCRSGLEMRWFYPIDWPQLSRLVRFERARGLCQGCGRPHGKTVRCLPDGRWFDVDKHTWRGDSGRAAPWPDVVEATRIRQTRVVRLLNR
jgi:hypothetical protein